MDRQPGSQGFDVYRSAIQVNTKELSGVAINCPLRAHLHILSKLRLPFNAVPLLHGIHQILTIFSSVHFSRKPIRNTFSITLVQAIYHHRS